MLGKEGGGGGGGGVSEGSDLSTFRVLHGCNPVGYTGVMVV